MRVKALLIAEIPTPSCCCSASFLLSRCRDASDIAAATSRFNLGACKRVQFSGTKYSLSSLSLVSFSKPFFRRGSHRRAKLRWIFSPNFGSLPVSSPSAPRSSGSSSGPVSSSLSGDVGSVAVGRIAGSGSPVTSATGLACASTSCTDSAASDTLSSERRRNGSRICLCRYLCVNSRLTARYFEHMGTIM